MKYLYLGYVSTEEQMTQRFSNRGLQKSQYQRQSGGNSSPVLPGLNFALFSDWTGLCVFGPVMGIPS